MLRKNKKKFVCHVLGKNVKYYDFDETRCTFANFAMTLDKFHFGYLCMFLLVIIAIISIFGRIKANYRWFILNQTIWDFLLTFNFIDHHMVKDLVSGNIEQFPGFFLKSFENFPTMAALIGSVMETQPYSALALLCLTRFLCLYFMNFYEKLTRKRRILYFIIIYNFVTLFFHCFHFIESFLQERIEYLDNRCSEEGKTQKQKDRCMYPHYMETYYRKDFWYNVINILNKIFGILVALKPVIFLLFSILATVMIIFRVGKQAKFQLKHNRRDFLNSFRISMVMFLQTCLYFFVFAIQFLKFIEDLAILEIDIGGQNVDYFEYGDDRIWCSESETLCLNFNLPKWLYSDMGLNDPAIVQTIVQVRIFLESIIVLALMTGYREAICNVFKFIYHLAGEPFEKYVKRRSGVSTSQVSIISGSKNSEKKR